MMPNSGARRCTRENVGGAAISTSHLVKLGSARMRTCERRYQDPMQHGKETLFSDIQLKQHQNVEGHAPHTDCPYKNTFRFTIVPGYNESFAREAVILLQALNVSQRDSAV